MRCDRPGCGGIAEYVGTTDDFKTKLHCPECGHDWEYGPADEEPHVAGQIGGQKYHCPVCPDIFSDQSAPIIPIGTPSRAGHRCDQTKSFRLGPTYGASEKALDARLAAMDDGELAEWPKVLQMKKERLGRSKGT